MATPRVFFITGCSTGFGAELVQVVLEKGNIAVATSRNASNLSFKNATEKNYLAISCDVTSQSSVDSAFDAAIKKFSRVDVIVNNAGYGLSGEFESLSDKQIRKQMEVNFFGVVNVTRRGLEVMRDQKPSGGVIQQITSMGGQVGVPTFSVYNASKFAVEGLSEGISKELKPEWGIHISIIEPGGFRTNWSGASMEFGENKSPAYDHIDAKKRASGRNGTQGGDPRKGALAMHELALQKDPPLRILLGSDAIKLVTDKIDDYRESIRKNEKFSRSTDIDE